jgi:uncharacterized NAD(P)/FAD-binding protein YdhS
LVVAAAISAAVASAHAAGFRWGGLVEGFQDGEASYQRQMQQEMVTRESGTVHVKKWWRKHRKNKR